MVIRYGNVIGVQSNAVEKKNKEEQGNSRKGKTQKKTKHANNQHGGSRIDKN
jgi:hypothetical protein